MSVFGQNHQYVFTETVLSLKSIVENCAKQFLKFQFGNKRLHKRYHNITLT